MNTIQQLVEHVGGPNLGGFINVFLIRCLDLISVPEPVDAEVLADLVLQPEAVIYQIKTVQDGVDYKVEDKWDDAGVAYNHKISITLSMEAYPEIRRWISANRQHYFVAIAQTPDRQYWLVGNLEYPLQILSQDISHGKAPSERPERSLSLMAMMPSDKLRYNPATFIVDESLMPIITPDEGLSNDQ